jgi:hypothetical protein
MVIKNHNVEQKAISVIADIFNIWCSEDGFPYNVDTSDLRWNDKGEYYDGQIVVRHKLAEKNKGLRFFIQSKGTTAKTYSGIKNYGKLLLDINSHKIPTFLFVVYLTKNTLEPLKFQFLFLNEQELNSKFSVNSCKTIQDLKNKNEVKKKVEEIISLARRYHFYSLSNRFTKNIPTEVHYEVDSYNNLLNREFYSVKKAIYPDIWKFSIFYHLDNSSFGRIPIPYGYSCSLIQEIPVGNLLWQDVCDKWGDFNWGKDKISTFLLRKDLELCIKNKLFDLSCLTNVPEFKPTPGGYKVVKNDYAEKVFLYLEQYFEEVYDRFCQENFPLLKSNLKLNYCNNLYGKVCEPQAITNTCWDNYCRIISKKCGEGDKHILVLKNTELEKNSKAANLSGSKNILIDSIYQTLIHKLEKIGYVSKSTFPAAVGVRFE